MKIGEILKLSFTKKIADIAREDLDISEKPARKALRSAGCYSIEGKRGWYFDGDESVLEQSIYEFAPPRTRQRRSRTVVSAEKEVSATIEKAEATINPSSQLSDKMDSKQVNNPTGKQIGKPIIKQSSNPTIKQLNKQVGKPTIQQSNNPSNKPVMKKVTYEIEEQLHDELKIRSIREKRTVSEIVNEIIKVGIKKI